MSTAADTTQTTEGSISGGIAPDGSTIDDSGVILTLLVPDSEIPTLIASYSPGDPNSPDVTTSRQIARAVLDALKAYTGT